MYLLASNQGCSGTTWTMYCRSSPLWSSSGGGVQDNVTYLDPNPRIARSCGVPGTAKQYPSVKIYTEYILTTSVKHTYHPPV